MDIVTQGEDMITVSKQDLIIACVAASVFCRFIRENLHFNLPERVLATAGLDPVLVDEVMNRLADQVGIPQ